VARHEPGRVGDAAAGRRQGDVPARPGDVRRLLAAALVRDFELGVFVAWPPVRRPAGGALALHWSTVDLARGDDDPGAVTITPGTLT